MAFLFSTALLYSIGSFDLRRLRIRASEMPDELLSMVLRSPVSAGKPSFAAYKATNPPTSHPSSFAVFRSGSEDLIAQPEPDRSIRDGAFYRVLLQPHFNPFNEEMCVSPTLLPFYPMIVLLNSASGVVFDVHSSYILIVENVLCAETLCTPEYYPVSSTESLVNQYNNVVLHSCSLLRCCILSDPSIYAVCGFERVKCPETTAVAGVLKY